MRARFYAAVISPVHVLLAENDLSEPVFRHGAVITERKHYFDSVTVRKRKIFFEVGHKRVVFVVPHLELNYRAHGVESRLTGNIEFVRDLIENFLMVIPLPHRDAIYAV